MVVLDASGSMKQADAPGPRIDVAKRAVTGLVAALPPDARVGLTVYGTSTGSGAADKAAGCRDIKQLIPVQAVDKAAFGTAVAGIRASGYTPIGRSLQAAARALPAEGPRSVVLVSDGEDTCAPPAPCDVAKQLKAAGTDLVVHTIGFKVNAAARAQLACIAAATGGTFREASSGAALGAILETQVQRAIQPYTAVGTPIRGGATPADAPAIRPGQYLDTYEKGGKSAGDDGTIKFYKITLQPGDTPYLSATLIPARPARPGRCR
jgi:Ca-activated chloride channel family protein